MKKNYALALILVLMIIVLAQSPCYAENMLRKAGRGLANFFTCVFEVPKSVQQTLYDEGPAAAVTFGLLDGLTKLVVRGSVGLFEVATFPIPIPRNYAPIVEPEFLFKPDEQYHFE